MSKKLIIVESPAKARTITRYLDADFKALASYGHVRDLVPTTGAVDTESDFTPTYELIERNKRHVTAIAKAMKQADAIYLATDPDREGEAISWHLYEILKERKLLKNKDVYRVEFFEFTKPAIQAAIENPRELSENLINAQQARRVLDYLVGFNLSPLLWRKVSPGLSAGRVQSPALRLIVEREEEIEAFVPREYWTIESDLAAGGKSFTAKLTHWQGEKLEQFTVNNESDAHSIRQAIDSAAAGTLSVLSVESKQRKRHPAPPFTTSTMQQEAARKLGFTAQRTMRTAQQLYEGITHDGVTEGLITYMRTDAVILSAGAVGEIRDFVSRRYGADNVPDKPQVYRNESKNAQEAHEAIRPTSVSLTPEVLRNSLNDEQFRLYQLIWKRTVACQMIHATMNTVAVELSANVTDIFRATGSTIANAGFMAVYLEGQDDSAREDDKEKILPPMKEGDAVDLGGIRSEQHFTEPPPRYSEASLVKTLEAYGIGRPSTYASIISTLVHREYVELESRRFTPTAVGRIVIHFLSTHFQKYVDYDFTAQLEDTLDAISRGEKEWVPVLREFWQPFKSTLDEKAEIPREEVAMARQLGTDPASGKPVSVRVGRYGPFAQIGTRDDEEKPRFAGLRKEQRMNSITLEEALKLFELPRQLGVSPDGEKITVAIGRFGPYVRYDDKFVSIKEEDPYTITFEQALELVAEKKVIDANRIIQTFEDVGIQILRGRYGPYITDGNKNARVPKDREPESLTREECIELIKAAPQRKGKKKKSKKKGTKRTTSGKKTTKKASRKKSAKKTTRKKTSKKTGSKTGKSGAVKGEQVASPTGS